MDLDVDGLITLATFMLAPAAVVLIVFTVIRVRRGKFHRQRITKGQSRKKEAS